MKKIRLNFLLVLVFLLSFVLILVVVNFDFYTEHSSLKDAAENNKINSKDFKSNAAKMTDVDLVLEFPISCFAPGTDPNIIQRYNDYKYAKANSLGLTQDDLMNKFNIGNRWSTTSTNGGGLDQGDLTTLTWSYVEDGTPIGNGGCGVEGESEDDSNVISFFNNMYGAPTTPGDYTTAPWHNIFVEMFDSWSAVSGLEFVYEPNDDGAEVVTSPGQLGVRGDIRISGHEVDGDFNVLACNYFPNNGDMIIDTSDQYFTDNPGTGADPFLGTVNVLTHEIGHGLGISHVCPVNETKLMEPFVSLAFQRQQEDDILAVNRSYGDIEGDNNTIATASSLGNDPIPANYLKSQRSIDDNSEVDYFSFTVNESPVTVNVILTPTGTTYLDGVQLPTGACSDGSDFNASAISDLKIELINQDGQALISTADSAGPGETEGILTSISNPGTYYVKISQQGNVDNVQMYDLEVKVGDCDSVIIPTNLQASSITGVSAILKWDAQDFALYDLRYRESGTTTWTEINDIIPSNQRIVNLLEFTEYEIQVRAKCSEGTPTEYSSSIFFSTVEISYCDSSGESQRDEYISNVQFGEIDNASEDENGGYSDFTSISTPVILGQDYPITLTPFWTGSTFLEGYAVWIDFNQNGDFSDPGELVYSESPTSNSPVSGIISIPLVAPEGETRMRVSMKFEGVPEPCEEFGFGEVEDYTVEIVDEFVGVEDISFGANFILYPNPIIDGRFYIETPNLNGEAKLEIFNLSGQMVYNSQLTIIDHQIQVNVNSLPSGVYLSKLSQDNQSFSSKLIIK